MRRLLLPLVAMLALPPSAAADDPSPVRARLVTDASSLAAGRPVRVGVAFALDEGWHLYWSNPGEAGLATLVELELAEGFEVGPVGWPVPWEFAQPGDLVGYGYEGEVVLAAVVTPVARASEATVTARASWLACRDVCVLGEALLEGRLPVEAAAAAAARPLLDSWASALPRDEAPVGLVERRLDGGWAPGGRSGLFTLWLGWDGAAPAGVEWFPDPGEDLRVDRVRVRSRANLTRVDLELTRLAPAGQGVRSTRLEGVLTVSAAGRRAGHRLALELPVGVDNG